MSTYKPLSDEELTALSRDYPDYLKLTRGMVEQCRRANRLAKTVLDLSDFDEPDPDGERRLLRMLRVGDALRAYLGENADD